MGSKKKKKAKIKKRKLGFGFLKKKRRGAERATKMKGKREVKNHKT